ncbi:MAG: hypothetical protein MUF75_11740 [Bacteroidia bacterium]|jgi:hypothetical protein|nr:hypothetical protein [Bacteroidia bacterium]
MRKIILLLFIGTTVFFQAQTKGSCFIEYYELFISRGVKAIPDGVQNVIVTVRDTKENTCFATMGHIEVKNGKIAGKLTLKNRAGEYVKPKTTLHPKYEASINALKADYSITNGMSHNFLTKDMKVVNVFFIDYLKPAPPSLTEAPDAKKL